jgi:signal peptidase I
VKFTRPFVQRHPAVATLWALTFGAWFGMLYLGRWREAIGYLSAVILIFVGLVLVPGDVHGLISFAVVLVACLAVLIIGAVHAYKVAAQGLVFPLPWYSRWYVLAVVMVASSPLPSVQRYYGINSWSLPSPSMAPGLDSGTRVLSFSSACRGTRAPQRGDIIIFQLTNAAQPTDYIKRVIGLPGETIQLREGRLYINDVIVQRESVGKWLREPVGATVYGEVLPGGPTYGILEISDHEATDNTPVFEVPSGHYFVLGDNRDNSRDSRFKGVEFVPRSAISGRADVVYWDHGSAAWRQPQ